MLACKDMQERHLHELVFYGMHASNENIHSVYMYMFFFFNLFTSQNWVLRYLMLNWLNSY